ncbi:MAG: YcxB family protein [Clostridia bacterium]|nr:YcxB family protein [Clostridia bacterium]
MEIKATCKYDFNAVRALTHLSFSKKNPEKRLISNAVLFGLLIAICIFGLINFEDKSIYYMGISFAVICALLLSFIYFFLPKIQYNSMGKMKDAETEFIFTDEEIKVVTTGIEYVGESALKYTLLVKAIETENFLFLFQTNKQAYIVDRASVSETEMESLRNKLCNTLGKKYEIRNY